MIHMPIRIPAGFTPEYAVYVYHRPENHLEGQSDWEMRSVTGDLRAALCEARNLHKSRNFRCVEVKQHLFRSFSGGGRTPVCTLRTFGNARAFMAGGGCFRRLAAALARVAGF